MVSVVGNYVVDDFDCADDEDNVFEHGESFSLSIRMISNYLFLKKS